MTPVCGVVETTHSYVGHPQVVADRLERFMAGTDCGFGTIVGDNQPRCPRTWHGPSSRRCATARRSPARGSGVEDVTTCVEF